MPEAVAPAKIPAFPMKLLFASDPPKSAAVLVRYFPKEERANLPVTVGAAEFSLGRGSLLPLPHAGDAVERELAFAEAGERGEEADRRAAVAAKQLGGWRRDLPALAGVPVGNYRFEEFLPVDRHTNPLRVLTLVVSEERRKTAKAAAERGRAIADAVNLARDTANQPPNVINPPTLADHARRVAHKHGLECEILDEKDLRKGKFGGLLAVGGASASAPRLIVLRHRGGKKGEAPVCIVGKAVTFDAGGLSIKTAEGMVDMVFDKCGGCAVLGAIAGIAKLGVRRNVTAIIPAAENMIGPVAYRPGDIVTAYGGKTIEVLNTDAEGRVILADALVYAVEDEKAAQIVDLATLTGACIIALGDDAAGLFSTHDDLAAEIDAAAKRAGEMTWRLPIFPYHDKRIRGDVGQVKNTGGRPGGASTAAAFLKVFAGGRPWVHLDIAGPAAIDKDRPGMARGATGYGVRTLLEWLAPAEAA